MYVCIHDMFSLSFQCIQLLASEMDSVDLSQLDEKALRSIRNLQVCVAVLILNGTSRKAWLFLLN